MATSSFTARFVVNNKKDAEKLLTLFNSPAKPLQPYGEMIDREKEKEAIKRLKKCLQSSK